jgi:hypothetical protein
MPAFHSCVHMHKNTLNWGPLFIDQYAAHRRQQNKKNVDQYTAANANNNK